MLLDVGESHVELLRRSAPTRRSASSSPRGPGLHHVAYQVDDIDAALDELAAAGMRLIDETPRTGSAARASPSCTPRRPAAS